jgi:hypothetical protein
VLPTRVSPTKAQRAGIDENRREVGVNVTLQDFVRIRRKVEQLRYYLLTLERKLIAGDATVCVPHGGARIVLTCQPGVHRLHVRVHH